MAIRTYQDLQEVGQDERRRMDFVKDAISQHKSSGMYSTAMLAHQYDMQCNPTIINYQKLLYKVSGEAVPDNFSANYKLRSNMFHRLVTELVQYLLGNGCVWGKPSREVSEETAKKYPADEVFEDEVWNPKAEMYVPQWYIKGTDRKVGLDFDQRLTDLFSLSVAEGVAFGFWNYDHLEVFSIREFCPIYDEENGALMAGIRFWQVASNKPMRATLYEVDGMTDYMWKDGVGQILNQKRAYKTIAQGAPVDRFVYAGENYEKFPIIPAWSSKNKMSALVGMRENLDAYDLIKSNLCNSVDEASLIYWTISNAGGMDEIDLAQFVDQMKRVKVGLVDSQGAQAEAHTIDVPYQSTEATLERLRNDIFDDFMALDPKTIASGATTATQIQAAYEPMNQRADELEGGVLDFIQSMLEIAGIKDKVTFNRSVVVNRTEEIQNTIAGATFLPEEYITKRLLTIYGDIDAYEDVMKMKGAEEMERMDFGYEDEETEKPAPQNTEG